MDTFSSYKLIYLYRHGETNWNVEDRITGQLENIDIYFTEFGSKQINEISEDIRKNKIEIIYSSDLPRARETAINANKNSNLPMVFCSEIRGLNMGKYQGILFKDFVDEKEVRSCFNDYDVPFENGESINQLNSRVINFIKKVCEETQYTKIAFISHSATISNLKSYLTGDKYISLNKCVITYNDGELYVKDYELNTKKI